MFELRIQSVLRRGTLIGCLLCAAAAAGADAASPAAGAAGFAGALRAALRNHPAVAGQEAEVAARRYAADGARSQRYPTFSAQAQQYTENDRSVLSGEDLSHPAVLRVRQPIWAFGRINDSIAVANAEVSAERADLLRVRRQLLEDVAVAYADVRGSDARIEIARRNVTAHNELLAQIERRVEGQLASSADAELAATRLAQARVQLQRAISDWERARSDLAALTQVEVSADEPVPAELLELPAPADLLELAMQSSADMVVKREQLARAEAEVDQARSAAMPTIYLQADQFYDQPGLRDDSQISVVFEASLDGLGFAARSEMGEAAARRMAATQDLAATRLELRRQLEDLQRGRDLQTELIGLQRRSLGDLESLLGSYRRQYETGTKSWLDLLNMQRELFEQRLELAQAESERQIYTLRLMSRIGGLDGVAGIERQTDG